MSVSVKSITKAYNGVKAVDNVSFEVKPGQIIGLLGPNGAGKTTTMSILTGILAADEGEILFDGKKLQDNEIQIKKKIGFLSEANPLYTDMLVHEYLDYMASLREIPKAERKAVLDRVMEETGITDRKFQPIEELSKGYKQRVGLAQAILHKPEILVLDEPTEGLDPNQRVTIRELIAKLGKDRTVLISTHVLSEVQAMCDHVIILNQGKLVSQGTVQEVMTQGQSAQVIDFEAKGQGIAETLKVQSGMELTSHRQEEGKDIFTVKSESTEDLRPKLFDLAKKHDWTIYQLNEQTNSLEDIFRNLTIGDESQDHTASINTPSSAQSDSSENKQ